MENRPLSNKNALVGGASRGIGKATAIALAKAGASVTIIGRNESTLLDVLKVLPKTNGQEHSLLEIDQNNLVKLKTALDERCKNSAFHIWINNTGGPKGGPLHQADVSELESAFRQHILAAQTILQAILPGMKEAKYGRIINVISTSVKQPIPNLGVSNTIRAAMANWAKTLAQELGGHGITVNNLLPGFTNTDRLHSIISNRAKQQNKTEAEIAEGMKATVPAQRFAQPEETGEAICFLASPQAAYINGINLPVDGGRTKTL